MRIQTMEHLLCVIAALVGARGWGRCGDRTAVGWRASVSPVITQGTAHPVCPRTAVTNESDKTKRKQLGAHLVFACNHEVARLSLSRIDGRR